jgi:predicted nucleic acid-binding protein
MKVVDASVWVSSFIPLDERHDCSRKWLESCHARGELLASPILLLAEVAGAISRRTQAAGLAWQAAEILLRLPHLRLVSIDPRLGRAAARLAADLGLRGADSVYVALAQFLKLPLITWDSDQAERARGRILISAPDADAPG